MSCGGRGAHARGLTLLELVLTVSIIVLLALLVVPKLMNATPRLAVESEGIRFKADIAYAQQAAIAHNRAYRLVFDCGDERVLIEAYDGEAFTVERERRLGGSVDLVSTTFDGDLVTFDRLGVPSDGGTVTLHGSDGTAATVTITPGTGRVSAESGGKPL
jgi:Tfp pilus assembly protein FimT